MAPIGINFGELNAQYYHACIKLQIWQPSNIHQITVLKIPLNFQISIIWQEHKILSLESGPFSAWLQ